jgi:DNA repair photolyase
MIIKEINVQNLVKKITKEDTLFHGTYTLDPYQNCTFGCIYCDSILDNTLYVKFNASEILKKELPHLPNKRIIIGSVHDPYQPVEQTYRLTHRILKILKKTNHSIHILTKSTSIIRDLTIIKELTDPIVTFTVLSLDEKIWKTIEPKTPSPQERLKTMQILANNNITTGISIIPILPYINTGMLLDLIVAAKQHKASYILHKPLFLQGEQKIYFMRCIKKSLPEVYQKYQKLYYERRYPPTDYIDKISDRINAFCSQNQLPTSIPIKK